ncbi:VWA domain-containing protein [uncultured Flavobacterium sp.]|uniref:nitric oxide reductase activation protein NorD n=1 Tax=uncultured Flavobacterium sp. TaxID=165435 RepID=UPI0030ED4562|tara:strand:+ start:209987 stop:211735 length:1749 start_codon:yes stop_codon:yes gene_type:complete
MELDEIIYSKVLQFFKKNKKVDIDLVNRTVHLEEIKPRLTILARAITGDVIEIFPAESEGGYKNNNFFLPISFGQFNTFEANLSFYFFRILYLTEQRKMEFNWNGVQEDNLNLSQLKALESAPEVVRNLCEEFPLMIDLHQEFYTFFDAQEVKDFTWLYGKWMQNSTEIEGDKNLNNFSDLTKKATDEKEQTVLKANPVEEIKSLAIDKKQQEDYVLLHSFEKVETAEEFNGNWRDFDGSDELEKHQEALEELNMKFTVRVDDTTHSVYQADFIENTTISESAERDEKGYHIKYNEWDYSKKAYKDSFCKVYPISQVKTDSEYYLKTISQKASILNGLRKMLANVNNKMQQHRRQSQGDEFDIDATTDMITDVLSKKTPSENIYLSKRKKEKDISILLLLDISLSSDSYAAGNKIIDVEKQVSILFGEILNEFDIDFSINCFFSKTRNYSTYLTLKDFDEDWQKAKYKIGAAEPQGYTRIGAALRHSGALLEKRESKNKWVIFLSDGKPNDYDKYEGKYGINDVKQALKELKKNQINTYALAIEAQAKYYLPLMFGQNHYQILTHPDDLLKSMVKLYEKIKH